MSRSNKRLKGYADKYIGIAKFRGKHEHGFPTFFDGTLDQYVSWLKYYQKQARLNGLDVLVSMTGQFKLTRGEKYVENSRHKIKEKEATE